MIGYVIKMYPKFSETFILTEILELERRGRRVHVLSLRRPDEGRFHEALARVRARVSYLPEHPGVAPRAIAAAHARALARSPRAYLAGLRLLALRPRHAWRGFLVAPLLAETARRAGCRRLHAHFATLPATTAMFASLLAGLPFSFTAHAKDIFFDGQSPRWLRELIERATGVVTVSEYNRSCLRRMSPSKSAGDRIVRIYNGVDGGRFRPLRAVPGPQAAPPLILAVGRLVEKKGFSTLIDACAWLRRRGVAFRCEIAGSGPLRRALDERVRERGLGETVALAGALTGEQVARRMREAALLAAPCTVARDGNRDGLPTVILEAMASGIPVVTTPVTGIPEAVAHGIIGRLVPEGDAPALARALWELLADPELRAAMGRSAQQRVRERFDVRRNVAQLDDWFRRTSGERLPARGEACS